jgi:hypothetical protein
VSNQQSTLRFRFGGTVVRRFVDVVVEGWVDHPALDYPLVVVATWLATNRFDPVGQITPSTAGTWYQTLAATAGVVLGFGTLAVTLQLKDSAAEPLRTALAILKPQINRRIASSLGGLLFVLLGYSLASLLDVKAHPEAVERVVVGLTTFGVLRASRLWWFVIQLVKVLARAEIPSAVRPPDSANPNATTRGSEVWRRPKIRRDSYSVKSRRDDAN